jgi:hypothetical protein
MCIQWLGLPEIFEKTALQKPSQIPFLGEFLPRFKYKTTFPLKIVYY